MNPLFIVLFRILSGERLRKPSPAEEQRWAGRFFIIGVYFGLAFLFLKRLNSLLDASAPILIAVAFVVVAGLVVSTELCGRFVPALISWVLGAMVWTTLFLLALTNHVV